MKVEIGRQKMAGENTSRLRSLLNARMRIVGPLSALFRNRERLTEINSRKCDGYACFNGWIEGLGAGYGCEKCGGTGRIRETNRTMDTRGEGVGKVLTREETP